MLIVLLLKNPSLHNNRQKTRKWKTFDFKKSFKKKKKNVSHLTLDKIPSGNEHELIGELKC